MSGLNNGKKTDLKARWVFEFEEFGGWQGKEEMFSRFKPSSGRKEIIVLLTKKKNQQFNLV